MGDKCKKKLVPTTEGEAEEKKSSKPRGSVPRAAGQRAAGGDISNPLPRLQVIGTLPRPQEGATPFRKRKSPGKIARSEGWEHVLYMTVDNRSPPPPSRSGPSPPSPSLSLPLPLPRTSLISSNWDDILYIHPVLLSRSFLPLPYPAVHSPVSAPSSLRTRTLFALVSSRLVGS